MSWGSVYVRRSQQETLQISELTSEELGPSWSNHRRTVSNCRWDRSDCLGIRRWAGLKNHPLKLRFLEPLVWLGLGTWLGLELVWTRSWFRLKPLWTRCWLRTYTFERQQHYIGAYDWFKTTIQDFTGIWYQVVPQGACGDAFQSQWCS